MNKIGYTLIYILSVVAAFVLGFNTTFRPFVYEEISIYISGRQSTIEEVKSINDELKEYAESYFAADSEITCSAYSVPYSGETKIILFIRGLNEFPNGFTDGVKSLYGKGAKRTEKGDKDS
jgi:hypothetical protein